MRRNGPYLTLLAVGLFMITMIVVNQVKAKPSGNASGGGYGAPAPAADTNRPAASGTVSTTESGTVSTTAPSSPAAPAEPASGFPADIVYTGPTSDPATSVAIAVRNDLALAYLCDGASLESWLTGPAREGRLALKSRAGNLLRATRHGTEVRGTLTVAGHHLRFSAVRTGRPGGLYTATIKRLRVRVTWIVRADGRQTGVRATANGRSAAPALDPTARTAVVDGSTVTATPVAGDAAPPS